jgi:archaemetzincin
MGVLHSIRQVLEDVFVARVENDVQRIGLPPGALDAARSQYCAPVVLKALLAHESAKAASGCADKLLAITSGDLFIPMLSFVYGQAQLGGRLGIVSLARLRQEFYGLPPNPDLLAARACKEAVHEAGHLFGLIHCERADCAMRLSTNVRQLDLKGDALCIGCAALARENSR